MYRSSILSLLAGAALTTACTLPTDTLSNTITDQFAVLIQNPAYPVIHNKYMNLEPAGGGDQHLFLAPAGLSYTQLVLSSGVLTTGAQTMNVPTIVHAVIGGEVLTKGHLTRTSH